ncbi:MAG: NfeD family protein [Bacillota bacterium]|nr:NfeD family protein [Bacillota bacterium]
MTIMGIALNAATIWLIAAALLFVIEAFTLGLTTVWFGGGAIGAAIAAMLGASVLTQVIVFMAVSILLLIFTRPIVKSRLNSRTEKTNIEAVIGQEGIAETDISEYKPGQVRADGKMWTAVCPSGTIPRGTVVTVVSIKGVTLTVEEKKEERV